MKEFDYDLHGVKPGDAWSALVFAQVYRDKMVPVAHDEAVDPKTKVEHPMPMGYVFIIDFGKEDPKYKLPGGHKLEDEPETPLQTAIRELHGETGIEVESNRMDYVEKWKRTNRYGTWWDMLFVAYLSEKDYPWMNMNHRENEGEQPKFFTVEEFRELLQLGGFLPKHYEMLDEKALVLWMSTP